MLLLVFHPTGNGLCVLNMLDGVLLHLFEKLQRTGQFPGGNVMTSQLT